MFADDGLADIRYDDLARMLAFEKPPGTRSPIPVFNYSRCGTGNSRCYRFPRLDGHAYLSGATPGIKSRLSARDGQKSSLSTQRAHDVGANTTEEASQLHNHVRLPISNRRCEMKLENTVLFRALRNLPADLFTTQRMTPL